MDLTKFETEARNPATMNIDQMSALEIVTIMNQEDRKIPLAIESCLQEIAALVDVIAETFEKGGRLIYIGAGTSGRLGVLDASECPPTYGVEPEQVVGLIAGGETALRNAVEGAEDSRDAAVLDLKELELDQKDVVVGIAASGRTPYVIAGLEYAKSIGCATGAIACNKSSEIGKVADIAIEAEVGPEVLTGSTRLKSGTAQKLILNMLTTASMVRIGKCYQNLLVDLIERNEKVRTRAENIVMECTGVERSEARSKINEADGHLKLAITMILTDSAVGEARRLLEAQKGHLRQVMDTLNKE